MYCREDEFSSGFEYQIVASLGYYTPFSNLQKCPPWHFCTTAARICGQCKHRRSNHRRSSRTSGGSEHLPGRRYGRSHRCGPGGTRIGRLCAGAARPAILFPLGRQGGVRAGTPAADQDLSGKLSGAGTPHHGAASVPAAGNYRRAGQSRAARLFILGQ